MSSVNTTAKEVLARLLATENLNVTHANVQTASFNLKERNLVLPAWDNMTNETYDHLVGHEVGHALYTPEKEWIDAVSDSNRGFQSFLNVVEDARIESMVQRRYPGLRRSFIQSYRKMMSDGFFGGDLETINSMKLIDRLNVYFKCGMSAGIRIDRSEMRWVEAIQAVETFEDVIRVAQELYAYEKEKRDQGLSEQQSLSEEMDEGDGFGAESDADGDEYDDGEDYFDEFDSADQSGQFEEQEKSAGAGGGAGGDLIAETVETLESNIRKEFSNDDSITRTNVTVNWNYSFEDRIFGYKKVLDEALFKNLQYANEFPTAYKKFLSNNKKNIDYLVKEFEMKKSAENYSRAAISSTGMIDTLKMNSYKYNDDIFRKVTVVPDGKNHGLLMFVDWSGSMLDSMRNTLEQMLNLVLFCRQVNIPFRVLTFTENDIYVNRTKDKRYILNDKVDEIGISSELFLCELFSNKMKQSEFTKMVQFFSFLVEKFDNRFYPRSAYSFFPSCLSMGSTPLNDTIIVAKNIFDQFKKNNRLDLVNIVFLTDGESNRAVASYQSDKDTTSFYSKSLDHRKSNNLKFLDAQTKKQYRVEFLHNSGYLSTSTQETKTLLTMLRDVTGANVIGFRIFFNKAYQVTQVLNNTGIYDPITIQKIRQGFTKEKFIEIPNAGYTKFFGLYNKDMRASSGEMEVASDANKSALRKAFSKANKDKLMSRVMLNKFIELIA